jgi:hypothetical protein
VFATECLRMIVTACEVDETHFDMEKARNRKNTTGQGMCIYLALCMYLTEKKYAVLESFITIRQYCDVIKRG